MTKHEYEYKLIDLIYQAKNELSTEDLSSLLHYVNQVMQDYAPIPSLPKNHPLYQSDIMVAQGSETREYPPNVAWLETPATVPYYGYEQMPPERPDGRALTVNMDGTVRTDEIPF